MIIGILFTLQVRDAVTEGSNRFERNINVIASTLDDAIDTYYQKTDRFNVAFERVVEAKLARDEDRPKVGIYIDENRIEHPSEALASKTV